MQLMVLVLNNTEYLEPLLSEFLEAGFGGATVLDSVGMLRVLDQSTVEPPPIFGSLRKFINPEHERSKTLFIVLPDNKLSEARDVVKRVTGGLDKPNAGILFAVPISFVEGICESDEHTIES